MKTKDRIAFYREMATVGVGLAITKFVYDRTLIGLDQMYITIYRYFHTPTAKKEETSTEEE